MRGPSFVEQTGDDNSATSSVAVEVRMSLKEDVWSSHMYSRIWTNRLRFPILLVAS